MGWHQERMNERREIVDNNSNNYFVDYFHNREGEERRKSLVAGKKWSKKNLFF